MSDFCIGNNQAGNFQPQFEIRDKGSLLGYCVQKLDGRLYLKRDNSNHLLKTPPGCRTNPDLPEYIGLEPLDETARTIQADFSEYQKEDNESIYRLEYTEGKVVIIFYTYGDVKRLDNDQSIKIHLFSTDESDFITNGFNKEDISNVNELLTKLSDRFVSNRSIFIQDKSRKNWGANEKSFTIIGDKCTARLRMERPGIYTMDEVRFNRNNGKLFGLVQIFGNISFIPSSEADKAIGNKTPESLKPDTNEIFEAWEEFVGFEEAVYDDELPDCIFRYASVKSNEEFMDFYVYGDIDLDKNIENDFEFISDIKIKGGEAPTDPEGIKALKNEKPRPEILVKKPSDAKKLDDRDPDNYGASTLIRFRKPHTDISEKVYGIGGTLYLSDYSYRADRHRKDETLYEIKSKNNKTANMIMRLSNPNVVDSQLSETNNPISKDVLKKMFGKPNMKLNSNYLEAMSIALNTPDIALIQGPPGTGKTTLIQGIIARIYELRKNCRILLSSEQHEALDNAMSKASNNQTLPAFKSSHRYDEEDADSDENAFLDNLETFQKKCLNQCVNALESLGFADSRNPQIAKILTILQEFEENDYSDSIISDNIEELAQLLGKIDKTSETMNDMLTLRKSSSVNTDGDADPLRKALITKIDSQRTDFRTYMDDDGEIQLRSLVRMMKNQNIPELNDERDLIEAMLSGEENFTEYHFPKFIEFVERLHDRYSLKSKSDSEDVREIRRYASERITIEVLKEKPKDEYDLYDIIEKFQFQLGDLQVVSNLVKKYTPVVGSTCAQSNRSTSYTNLVGGHYDYVIVDEAARANPVDIMIPLMLGSKVIMVGDQCQLPHYIESKVMDKFKEDPKKYSEFKRELLEKSLFLLIYENLERAYKDNKVRCPRTAMLKEQHRMNPLLGTYISEEFYDGKLENAEETAGNKNTFGVFNGKNLAYIDVPRTNGREQKSSAGAISRTSEIIEIKKILEELISKNRNDFPTVGIMSFYKKQVEIMNDELERMMVPDYIMDKIFINTVDSFQGKEFDIVILSGTRSNTDNELGFIDKSHSRVNVALSRAKKLLVFVGDKETFSANEHFRNFFKTADLGRYSRWSDE